MEITNDQSIEYDNSFEKEKEIALKALNHRNILTQKIYSINTQIDFLTGKLSDLYAELEILREEMKTTNKLIK